MNYYRFAVGRSTALVIDDGADVTSVVPVHEGFILKKGIYELFFFPYYTGHLKNSKNDPPSYPKTELCRKSHVQVRTDDT